MLAWTGGLLWSESGTEVGGLGLPAKNRNTTPITSAIMKLVKAIV